VNLNLLGVGGRPEGIDSGLDQRLHGRRPERKVQIAGDNSRNVQQVLDQTGLGPARALDGLNRFDGLCGIELPTGE
jgi:hypothetical protein